jgi:hypothetical protein
VGLVQLSMTDCSSAADWLLGWSGYGFGMPECQSCVHRTITSHSNLQRCNNELLYFKSTWTKHWRFETERNVYLCLPRPPSTHGSEQNKVVHQTMPEHDPPTGPGFLSGVFSFVSREIEGFITTATGGTLSGVEEAQACSFFKSFTCCN